MANLYVRSTDGSDVDNGTTWALAKASVAGAAAIDAAGDVIFVSQNHAESNAAAQAWAFAGTAAGPVKVICGNDGAEPPTATATTATCTTTGANGFTITGFCYVYGVTINSGSGAVTAPIAIGGDTAEQTYEQCSFVHVATGNGTVTTVGAVGNAQPSRVVWNDCHAKFGGSGQNINIAMASFFWNGGTVLSGSSAATSGLIRHSSGGEYARTIVSGVDLTNVGVTGFIVAKATNCRLDVVVRNCKIPAWTTGGLLTGTLQPGDRVSMYNCDSSDPTTAGHRLEIRDYFGTITSDTTVYNDSSPNDGLSVPWSWKMVSTADTEFPHQLLCTNEIVRWNDTTGSSVTATVEIVHNSQGAGTGGAFTDAEIWLEILYYSTSGTPLGAWTSDRCGNLNLNSNAADQASSTASWTGDAAGWDTQKLTVSFTPQEKGFVHCKVCLADASATVYVDPNVTLA